MSRGPYAVESAHPLEQRLKQCEAAPLCKCGCGKTTEWDWGRARWRPYASRLCYHGRSPHCNRDWLLRQYVELKRSAQEIATDCGVTESAVFKAMTKHGIARRSHSEAHIGTNRGSANPAWKGGIAKWPYAPEWKRIARGVREAAGYTCQRCDERRKRWGNALHVHHIDKNKFNNAPDNLIALCATCHRKVEYTCE